MRYSVYVASSQVAGSLQVNDLDTAKILAISLAELFGEEALVHDSGWGGIVYSSNDR